MSEREAFIRRMFDTVINDGNLDAVSEFFSPDYVDHGPGGDLGGPEAFQEAVGAWRAGVPDIHCAVENWFESGDMAGWTVRASGTFTGEMMGMPPTGKTFEYVTANIGRFAADGKAIEHWADQGMFQFLTQVGMIPAPVSG